MKQIIVPLPHVSENELIAQFPPQDFFSFALPREEPLRAVLVGSLAREELTGATPSLLTACARTVETMPAQRTNLGRSEDDHTSSSERGQDDDLLKRGW